MSHSYSRLLFHIVFSTKERVACMGPELRPKLHAYLGGIVRGLKGHALAVNGTGDHIHALAVLPAVLSVSDAIRVIKCNSSRWVHGEWGNQGRFAWQGGYGVFSVSQSATEDVIRYISNQEQHHRQMSLQEEFLLLLRRHGIAFDEATIWD